MPRRRLRRLARRHLLAPREPRLRFQQRHDDATHRFRRRRIIPGDFIRWSCVGQSIGRSFEWIARRGRWCGQRCGCRRGRWVLHRSPPRRGGAVRRQTTGVFTGARIWSGVGSWLPSPPDGRAGAQLSSPVIASVTRCLVDRRWQCFSPVGVSGFGDGDRPHGV